MIPTPIATDFTDGDEVGPYGTDPTAADSDGDGLRDPREIQVFGTNPNDPDTDGDGLRDDFELRNHFDPHTGGEENEDPDGDGLDNLDEQAHGTKPNDVDSDDDGLSDQEEVAVVGTDPVRADTDGDRLTDGFELTHGFSPFTPGEGTADPDGDGAINVVEQLPSINQHDPDSNNDGLSDRDEVVRVASFAFEPQTIIAKPDTAQEVDRSGSRSRRRRGRPVGVPLRPPGGVAPEPPRRADCRFRSTACDHGTSRTTPWRFSPPISTGTGTPTSSRHRGSTARSRGTAIASTSRARTSARSRSSMTSTSGPSP